jgi:hypothetical protein
MHLAHTLLMKTLRRHGVATRTKGHSMQATILAHETPGDAASEEIHRFTFQVDDDDSGTLTDAISLRTARVIVEHLREANAFIRMLRVIVSASPADYNALIGRVYADPNAAPGAPGKGAGAVRS